MSLQFVQCLVIFLKVSWYQAFCIMEVEVRPNGGWSQHCILCVNDSCLDIIGLLTFIRSHMCGSLVVFG